MTHKKPAKKKAAPDRKPAAQKPPAKRKPRTPAIKKGANGKKTKRAATSAAALKSAEDRAKALQMRMAGATYPEIASTLKRSLDFCHTAVKSALEESMVQIEDLADELRDRDMLALEKMQMKLWPMAMGRGGADPDLKAVDRVVKVMDRRAKLMGLDVPAELRLTGKDGGPVEVADAKEQLLAKVLSAVTAGSDNEADS